MSAFGEVIVAVVAWLIEVSIYVTLLAFAPFRFLFSHRYRTTCRQRWHGYPGRRVMDVLGGSIALLLFTGMLSWWVIVFTGPAKTPPKPDAAVIKKHVIEKIQNFRGRHQ